MIDEIAGFVDRVVIRVDQIDVGVGIEVRCLNSQYVFVEVIVCVEPDNVVSIRSLDTSITGSREALPT